MRGSLLAVLVLVGCASSGPPAPSATCDARHEAVGEVCAVRFDDCGPNAVPLPGGGCETIGVPAAGCGPGLPSDGAGGCVPSLPAPCAEGTMAVPGDAACVPVGVTTCGAGFEPTGGGGCVAKLPAAACPPGQLAVPGEAACREVAACGPAPYGDVPTAVATLYVDATYAGTDSDGSKAKPYATVGAAVSAASPTSNTLIAIAAGTYVESLTLDKPIRLHGRCPSLVQLTGKDAATVSIRFAPSEIRGLAITGPKEGVRIEDAAGVIIEDTWIHDTGGTGVLARRLTAPTDLELKNVLVERATVTGVELSSAKATVEVSVIRDTRADGAGKFGRGLDAEVAPDTKQPSELVVRGSLVERNFEAAVYALGSSVTLSSTAVRDTRPRPDGTGGYGVAADVDRKAGVAANVNLSGVTIERSSDRGIRVAGAKLVAEDTVVRDTAARGSDGKLGYGVYGLFVLLDDGTASPADLILRRCLVERAHGGGVFVEGSTLTLEGSLVRTSLPRASDGLAGHGVYVGVEATTKRRSTATLRRTLLADHVEAGLYLLGSTATLESSVVRGTTARKGDGQLGAGVLATRDAASNEPSDLTLRGSLIDKNVSAGVVVVASSAKVEGSVVRDTAAAPAVEESGAGLFAADDGAGNRARLEVSGTVLSGNTTFGAIVLGADATLTSCVIRDTKPTAAGALGGGVLVSRDGASHAPAWLRLTRSLVERHRFAGVLGYGAALTLESTLVRAVGPEDSTHTFGFGVALIDDDGTPGKLLLDRSSIEGASWAGLLLAGGAGEAKGSRIQGTRASPEDGRFGDGIAVLDGAEPASLEVTGCLLRDNARAGVGVWGSAVRIVDARFSCNAIDLDFEERGVRAPILEDRGGTACGCAGKLALCAAQRSLLAPIPLPPPPVVK